MTAKPKMPVPLEHEEQAVLIRCCRAYESRYPELRWLFAVPNGARVGRKQAIKLWREGMRKGVLDLWLIWGKPGLGIPGLVIEMKRADMSPSDVKPEQREWIQHLEQTGWLCYVCTNAAEAWRRIATYLEFPEDVRCALDG